ncbi:YbjN domain-containing protein [Nioella aestuarii]|uniref:YbjN domain-containing protein n=1 Tax=Nioella aestuarii TaxID=1662864 RepID=UPI003D7FDEC4
MRLVFAATAIALSLAAPAAAQMMGNTPQDIMSVAQGFGPAQMETSNSGQPMMTGTIEGNNYGILMYGCEDGACDSLQFFASFTTERNGLTLLNQWNEDQRFGAAYVSRSGSVILHWSVNIDFGVSRQNFADSFDIWRLTLAEFSSHLTP